MRAADVEPLHLDAGRLRHGCPHVARVRDLRQELLRKVGAQRGRGAVDNRRRAADRDGFLQVRDLHLLIDGQGLADHHANAFALDVLKSGQFKRQLIDAGRQRLEAEAAIGLGDLHLRLNQRRAGRSHRRAGQHRTGVVGQRPVDTASEILRHGRAAGREHRDKHQTPRNHFPHCVFLRTTSTKEIFGLQQKQTQYQRNGF